MADKTIGSLPPLSALDDDALLVVELNGQAVKMTGAQWKQYAIDAVAEQTQAAEDAADRAAAEASHPPMVDEATGFWLVWDREAGQYVTTSLPAQGPQGDVGPSAYDAAVEAGYTGTEAQFNAEMEELTSLKEDVLEAKTAAQTARSGAEAAETNAANSAQAAAGSVNAAAGAAGAAAASEKNAAASAQSAAGSAAAAGSFANEAEAARNNAAASETAATNSAGAAAGAATAAEAAKTDAQTAQTGAENAKNSAVTAQGKAEEARTGAETAQTGAESAKNDAETARSGAETAESNAADSAAAAANSRTAAEAAQGKAEAAVGKTSYIGDNGNWFEWDAATGTFVDSGVYATGPKGEQGEGLTIKGQYATTAAVPSPQAGDNYYIGEAAPYEVWTYTATGWVNGGQLQGPQGDKGDPGKDGDKGDPGHTPVKGVDYFDGQDGVGIASVEQTTTSAEDDGSNVVTVTLTDGQAFTFTVQNGSKGGKGDPGQDGDPGPAGDSHVPVPTADNNDQFLCVVNGAAVWITVESAEGGAY